MKDMAGYSAKPLHEKLGLKIGHRLSFDSAPDNVESFLDIPAGIERYDILAPESDLILSFHTDPMRLEALFPDLIKAAKNNGSIWIAWPKKASGVATKLNENMVRNLGLSAGVVDVKVCAISDVWSGLKFVRRLKDR